MTQTREALGPAERTIQTLLTHADHMIHNRPGYVAKDVTNVVGVRWAPVTHKVEADGHKTVFRLDKVGSRTNRVEIGKMNGDMRILSGQTVVGEYRPAGLFPEIVAWMYKQVAEVWKLDNEFAARWASYAFVQDHRDLKVILAAFMLVQNRKGDPVLENDKVVFHDEDFRDVGEAMCLLYTGDKKELNPKLLLRVYDVLTLPAVAETNRQLGFTKSARKPFLGRLQKVIGKWLQFREDNPILLKKAVEAGWRTTIMELARRSGFKPESPLFFDVLRWKQKQAPDGRRQLGIGREVQAAVSWQGHTEKQVCEEIVKTKLNWKRIVGLLPKEIGVTRAVMAAAISAGSVSEADLRIMTPTLEELGLLQVKDIKAKWEKAVQASEDMRTANIALRVKSQEVKEKLREASDAAVKKATAEVVKGLHIGFIIDISSSMGASLDKGKEYVGKFLGGLPADKISIVVFNSTGREVKLKHHSAAGVENAFKGIQAGGSTDYGAGTDTFFRTYKHKKEEDLLLVYIGDERNFDAMDRPFVEAFNNREVKPVAFGLIRLGDGRCVQSTAAQLGIPCFKIDNDIFGGTYEIPRTIRNLIAATPVGKVLDRQENRVTLIDQILKTELLKKPAWAS